jgi:hypothetical protein
MFSRFGGALVLVVLISLAGIALEKRILSLRRAVSEQTYRLDELRESHAIHRLRTQQLGAPSRLIESLEANGDGLTKSTLPSTAPALTPTAQNSTGTSTTTH